MTKQTKLTTPPILPPAPKAAPPPPPAAPSAPAPTQGSGKNPRTTIPSPVDFKIGTGIHSGAARIGVYGPGGIGKSTLAAYLPAPLFIDLEHGTRRMNVARIEDIRDFATLRGALASIASNPPAGVKSIVIDSLSVVEEMVKDHVVATRKTEKGLAVDGIEGFGFGKGWNHVYDEQLAFFADLDRLVDRHGLNVCCIAHECTSFAPNPYGEDFLRYEPHLYNGDKRERSSTRKFFRNWVDELLFIGYDVHVQDGKGQGAGTRTVYTSELPTHMAKSRTNPTSTPFILSSAAAIWKSLGVS